MSITQPPLKLYALAPSLDKFISKEDNRSKNYDLVNSLLKAYNLASSLDKLISTKDGTNPIKYCGSRNFYYIIHNRKTIPYHIAVWIIHYKQYPECRVEHVDGDNANNYVQNLRLKGSGVKTKDLLEVRTTAEEFEFLIWKNNNDKRLFNQFLQEKNHG